MLIYSKLEEFKKTLPHKICLVYGQTYLTFKDMAQIVDSTALSLGTLVSKGQKVILKSGNSLDVLVYLYALSVLGAVSIPVNPDTPTKVCNELMVKSQAKLVIDDGFILPCKKNSIHPQVEPSDLFLGALSSGSTGDPKIIWRNQAGWIGAFPHQGEVFKIDNSDKLFINGSLSYTANLNACLHMLWEGGTVVIAKSKYPKDWARDIIKHNITSIFMVPANYRLLLKSLSTPVDSVNSLVSAGAKIDIRTVLKFKSVFPSAHICEYYGASELGHVTCSFYDDIIKYPESVGKAFPGVNLRLENGLIYAKSPYLAPAFSPEATVGDMGYINDEGYLFVTGREKEIINTGGIKVIPIELEKMILKCHGVTECAVQGIDDSILGQKIGAWIVIDKSISQSFVKYYIAENIPKQFWPHKIYFIRSIPKNPSGKVDKRALLKS